MPAQRKPRLLLAEDHPATRELLHELLSPEYEVEAVVDGAQAWAAARRQTPDLVLSDVMMPGLDGIALTRRLRADPSTATVLVVLLTIVNSHEQLLQGLAAGVDDFLLKPFRPLELLARLRTHCQLIELRRESFAGHTNRDGSLTLQLSPAAVAGRAPARARHLETELLAIQELERVELSRALHEGICQHLTGARMLLHALANDLKTVDGAAQLQQKAAEIEACLLDATAEARTMAHELTPVEIGLENQPFRPVLEGLAARTISYLGMECAVRCPEEARWTSSVATHLYRIAQEAVTNAHRHGGAGHIEIRLAQRARRWRLLVIDDGTGIQADEPEALGVGLRTMMYRAAMIGGTLMVRNAYGSGVRPGTIVCCSFAGVSC